MADPFMQIAAFEAEFGPLTDGQTATATRLLQVVSDHIRSLKDDVDTDAATQVVFEVVRDELNYSEYQRLSDYSNTVMHKSETKVFDKGLAGDDYLSDRQKRFLGIVVSAPAANFPHCDTGIPGYDY